MKLAERLRQLLSQGVSGNQKELVAHLERLGIQSTQSSVSRALRKIHAVKGTDASGNTKYYLPKEDGNGSGRAMPGRSGTGENRSDPGFLKSLVHRIGHNNTLIVVNTRPGTASTVAKFIDDHGFEDVLGTVAGDDTILIAPRKVADTDQIAQEISAFLKKIGILIGNG